MSSPTAKPGQFPAQIVVMVSELTDADLRRRALNEELSLSEVTRTSIDAGLKLLQLSTDYGISIEDLINAAGLHAIRSIQG